MDGLTDGQLVVVRVGRRWLAVSQPKVTRLLTSIQMYAVTDFMRGYIGVYSTNLSNMAQCLACMFPDLHKKLYKLKDVGEPTSRIFAICENKDNVLVVGLSSPAR